MKNFSHAACAHPSTKVARAACRRERSRSIPQIESPIITAWNAMKAGPLELTAAPVQVVTIAAEITRQNWREFKGQRAIVLTNDDEATTRGEITGWSANMIQIKGDKTVRIANDNIVTVVTDNA